jgi:hypothetical protein
MLTGQRESKDPLIILTWIGYDKKGKIKKEILLRMKNQFWGQFSQ